MPTTFSEFGTSGIFAPKMLCLPSAAGYLHFWICLSYPCVALRAKFYSIISGFFLSVWWRHMHVINQQIWQLEMLRVQVFATVRQIESKLLIPKTHINQTHTPLSLFMTIACQRNMTKSLCIIHQSIVSTLQQNVWHHDWCRISRGQQYKSNICVGIYERTEKDKYDIRKPLKRVMYNNFTVM